MISHEQLHRVKVGQFYWVERKSNLWQKLQCAGWHYRPANFDNNENEELFFIFKDVDYRLEIPHTRVKSEEEYMSWRNAKNKLAGYMPDVFTTEGQLMRDAQRARAHKIDASAAMKRKTYRDQAEFATTFDGLRANKERLTKLRNGEIKERTEWDWTKIGLSLLLQATGGTTAYLFSLIGGWPIGALIVAGILILNYAFLKNYQG